MVLINLSFIDEHGYKPNFYSASGTCFMAHPSSIPNKPSTPYFQNNYDDQSSESTDKYPYYNPMKTSLNSSLPDVVMSNKTVSLVDILFSKPKTDPFHTLYVVK